MKLPTTGTSNFSLRAQIPNHKSKWHHHEISRRYNFFIFFACSGIYRGKMLHTYIQKVQQVILCKICNFLFSSPLNILPSQTLDQSILHSDSVFEKMTSGDLGNKSFLTVEFPEVFKSKRKQIYKCKAIGWMGL